MLKYIKWICLVLSIILLIILGIKFYDYNTNDNDNSSVVEKDDELEILYNRIWNKLDTSIYKSDGTASGMDGIYEEYYMILTSDYASYCKIDTSECIDYEYIYSDGIFTINSEDYFLPKGTYKITFDENNIELTQEIDGDKTIHRFSVSQG